MSNSFTPYVLALFAMMIALQSGGLAAAQEPTPNQTDAQSNGTSVPYPNVTAPKIVDLNVTPGYSSSAGSITPVTLSGLDLTYLQFNLPPSVAFDVVVFLRADESCGPLRVFTAFDADELPEPRSPLVGDASGGGGGNSNETLIDRLRAFIVKSVAQSWLCEEQAEVAFSVKSSGATGGKWSLMLQSRYSGSFAEFATHVSAVTSANCTVQVFHVGRATSTLELEVALLIVVPTLFLLWGLFAAVRMTRREHFRFWHWSLTIGRVHLLLPAYLQMLIVRGILLAAQWCSGRYEERKRRLATEQRDLLSPSSRRRARKPDAAAGEAESGTSMAERGSVGDSEGSSQDPLGPASVQPLPSVAAVGGAHTGVDDDDDEDSCRICREDGLLEALVAPCQCTGSVKFVHQSCLDKWRIECAERRHINANQCEICKTPFKVSITRAKISKAVALRVLEAVVLGACFYIVFIASSIVARGTVGELSCLAPYHRSDYRAPFGFWSFVFGGTAYGLFVLFVFVGAYFTFLDHRSEPGVIEAIENGLPPAPLWTLRRRILMLMAALWPPALFTVVGYVVKFAVYAESPRMVWSFEIAMFVGAFAVFVVYLVVMFIILAAIAIRRHVQVASDDARDDAPRHTAGTAAAAATGALAVPTADTHPLTDENVDTIEPRAAEHAA